MENYPKFTKDMVKTHTILIPSMLDIHFKLFESALNTSGYKTEILTNTGPEVAAAGLKYVHNDTCYPALLVIGQFIDNLSRRDDLDKVVLLITQTGGGCRASNYIHLLRKALSKAGYGYIPVVSLNASNLEKDSGLILSKKLLMALACAITYGDMLMYLKNKTLPYEEVKGETDALVNDWVLRISDGFLHHKYLSKLKKNLKHIAQDFDKIKLLDTKKPKVGIVGEIYIKYAALGNNHLERFLIDEGAEVVIPGVLGFLNYCLYNGVYDNIIYGGHKKSALKNKLAILLSSYIEGLMIKAISKNSKFHPMARFKYTASQSEGFLSHGTKMGEGWLLTAEMVELIKDDVANIICAQPFGCLPNHICGKGVMKKIKDTFPSANIVAIDYDPSATKVNQENRIKLMLAIARENM